MSPCYRYSLCRSMWETDESETFFQFCCSVGSGGHIPGQFYNPDEQVRLNTPSDRKLHAAQQQTQQRLLTKPQSAICCLHNIINGEVHEQWHLPLFATLQTRTQPAVVLLCFGPSFCFVFSCRKMVNWTHLKKTIQFHPCWWVKFSSYLEFVLHNLDYKFLLI